MRFPPKGCERKHCYRTLFSGGSASGVQGSLQEDGVLNVTLHVLPNDDPHGLFRLPPPLSELQVAEDFNPGEEALTTIDIPVMRDQGVSGPVAVRVCPRTSVAPLCFSVTSGQPNDTSPSTKAKQCKCKVHTGFIRCLFSRFCGKRSHTRSGLACCRA